MLDEQAPVSTGTEDTTTSTASTEAPTPEGSDSPPPRKRAPRKAASRRTAPAAEQPAEQGSEPATPAVAETPETGDAPPPARKRAPRKTAAKKAAAAPLAEDAGTDASANASGGDMPGAVSPPDEGPEQPAPAKRTRRAPRKTAAKAPTTAPDAGSDTGTDTAPAGSEPTDVAEAPTAAAKAPAAPIALFQPPDPAAARPVRKRATRKTTRMTPEPVVALEDEATEGIDEALASSDADPTAVVAPEDELSTDDQVADDQVTDESSSDDADESEDGEGGARRRRRRGGRRRRRGPGENGADSNEEDESSETAAGEDGADGEDGDRGGQRNQGNRGGGNRGQGGGGRNRGGQGKADQNRADQNRADEGEQDTDQQNDQGPDQGDSDSEGGTTRRRRRRRRSGDGDDTTADDPENTVVRVRKPRVADDEISTFSGSTRLEAKKQRRREGREAGRRRAPIISEAEFLARREAVDRKMVIRQKDDLTQIAVLEDDVLVEHYVARDSQTSLIGNVYLGRVQNVLPSMEAAFIDIGKGRNAVLYAGEVNWDALGAKDGKQRKIEQVLKPGQSILVQVSKDPIGHKGARLTSQVSLPGRFLVYVPDGTTSGISRKLPENERTRLKTLLKEIVPDTAGVIVRTAAEGASETELTRDVARLKALWEDIESKVEGGNAPHLLYGEPDLTVKVVRDLFTEDIGQLVISGEEAWQMVEDYVSGVAPDLAERVARHDDSERDAFAEYRIDEQIAKALDRKVWLPSGGSLVIDRTEAMTVVDVNTGKFTGSGGNLEETVTKNNLEAAEEIVRQLRLRDIGGIIVIDFIDMVLENNRDLVLRRLIECLGRDRTRHQVAEVTSLGLVQMTRKRIGTGLLEAFSEPCEHCQGRGLHLHSEPVDGRKRQQSEDDDAQRGRRGRGRGKSDGQSGGNGGSSGAKKAGNRDGSASEGNDTGNGSVRRPTPAEFAAMVRSEAAAEARAAGEAEEGSQEVPVAPPVAPEELPDQSPDQALDHAPDRALEQAPQEPAVQPVEQPVAEPEPVATPVPTGPRIVTRVRRSGARRAAGPPPGVTADGGAVDAQPAVQVNPSGDVSADASGAASGDASGGAQPFAEGPGADEANGLEVDGIDLTSQPHVPVKKKGSRKR
jgi:ribonuclease E